MEKTKIDWTESTWNPVTGCLHGCEYCYARNIAHRFSGGGENWTDDKIIVLDEKVYGEEQEKSIPYPYGFIPTLHRYRLNDYIGKKGRNIFVCSMADLFGDWVPDEWIQEVFDACEKAPQHNYLFLTKNPQRYVELQDKKILPKKDNMWYGTSITDGRSLVKFSNSYSSIHFRTNLFLSVEPILSDISKTATWNELVECYHIGWVIVGAETGKRKDKVIPKREWIEQIAFCCYVNNIPLFMKSSLADIWGEPLIQEFPEGLKRKG